MEQLDAWWLFATVNCSTSSVFWVVFSGLSSLILIHVAVAHFRPRTLPPGPLPLPLLGNLHQLLKPLPHQALASLAKQHGPLMCLHMGSRLALFISNGAMAKMFFQANDRQFASRPSMAFCNRLLYGQHSGVAFSVYGPAWQKMRRICTLELFTTKRIQSFHKVLERELELIVSELRLLCQQNAGSVELNVAHLAHLIVSNMMGSLVISKRMCDTFVHGESLLDMFRKTNDAIVPTLGDFIPYLGSLLDLKNTYNMDRVHKYIDNFLTAILDERHAQRAAHPNSAPADFLDVLLSNEEVIELGDGNIKATLMDMLGAGSETSSITIEWVMAELLRNPHCLAKLQMELDAVCPTMAESVLPVALLSSESSGPSLRLPWQNVLASSPSKPTASLISSFFSKAHSEWYSTEKSSSSSVSPPGSLSSVMSSSTSKLSLAADPASLSSSPCPLMACSQTAQAHYLKAVVKETLRLHPPVPLLIPRDSMGSTCEAVGYTFPANTMLFVNSWAMGRDGEAWEEPEVYRPERFITGGGNMDLLNNYQMLPFGAGRRRCPGMGLALCVMELTVATLVRAFHWDVPDGYVLELSERSGNAGTYKAKPLIAVLTPR